MKVTLNEEKQKGIEYPCLMIAKDSKNVYLMGGKISGMRIHSINGSKIGMYSESLYIGELIPFSGSITFEND
jgi:hypothetical protein